MAKSPNYTKEFRREQNGQSQAGKIGPSCPQKLPNVAFVFIADTAIFDPRV